MIIIFSAIVGLRSQRQAYAKSNESIATYLCRGLSTEIHLLMAIREGSFRSSFTLSSVNQMQLYIITSQNG